LKRTGDKENHATRILIIDDDENMRVTLSDLTEMMGLEPMTAKNGTEALKILSDHKNNFDIVLTDMMMPDYTGLDMLRVVKKKNEHALVVIITGYGSIENAVDAIRAGAYDYIAKPFTVGEMEILVRNAVERIYLTKENIKLTKDLQDLYKKMNLFQEESLELRKLHREIMEELKVHASRLDKIYELMRYAVK
jgi:DNA-binding NtrC family response regulator